MAVLDELGIATTTITYGKDRSFAGAPAKTQISITPKGAGGADLSLVWDATGDTFTSFTDSSSADANVVGQIIVPQSGQNGFLLNGAAYKDWYWEATVVSTLGGSMKTKVYRFQTSAGVTAIDIDRLPVDGQVITPPVSAPLPVVSSVNGQTGNVLVEGATDAGVTGLFADRTKDFRKAVEAWGNSSSETTNPALSSAIWMNSI